MTAALERINAKLRVSQVADELIEEFHIKSLGEIDMEPVVYSDGIYVKRRLWLLKRRIQEVEPEANNPFVSEVIGRVQRLTAISAKDFDANTSFVALRNGILDIREHQVLPFDPKYLMFSKLDIEYQTNHKSRAFERFMADFLPNIDDRLRALDMFASTLLIPA